MTAGRGRPRRRTGRTILGRCRGARAYSTGGRPPRVWFVDATADQITLSLEATCAFTNPMGEVLGAFQAAMLYATMGPALLARIGPEEFIETLQLNVHFLNPSQA
jgi:acyl-coenzyme A thioesterase PaaI-like protein